MNMKMNCTSLTLVYSTHYCDVNVTKMYYAAMEDVIAIQKVNSTDNPDEWFCTTDNESLFLDKKYVYDTYCKNSQNLYVNVHYENYEIHILYYPFSNLPQGITLPILREYLLKMEVRFCNNYMHDSI